MRYYRTRAALLPFLLLLTAASPAEMEQWRQQADRVTITRDNWGIPHVKGRSDADAVFGMMYAQAEDDFPRIEANYLGALGRTAEADGAQALWQDLRARLYVSESELKAHYAASPPWLRRLMDSWAAGLNYYLALHPQVKPRVLTRFEPWMALSFTEGSIGGDIERIDLTELEKFYGDRPGAAAAGRAEEGASSPNRLRYSRLLKDAEDFEPRGSNGIAIAPALSRSGKALLLINPHTSFFFRSEQQVTSDEGLNVYGAATWGQFFIYQGFNARAGWMHTTSGVDVVDEFAYPVQRRRTKRYYRYGSDWRELGVRPITIRYRTSAGRLATRRFATYRTHRGPIVRSQGGRWVAFAMMDRPVKALQQSFLRTKVKDFGSFLEVARLQANSSNNTVFADATGAIAYLHPQFVPRRNDRFDYTRVVDGSDVRTDWASLHSLAELPNVISPPNGWIQNTNNWPYSAAGPFSADPKRYARYMDTFGENPRGLHAAQLLTNSKSWTLEGLQAAAYDEAQPGFGIILPGLLEAWDALPNGSTLKTRLAEPISTLRDWNYRWKADSVANTLANFWGDELWKSVTAPQWDDGLPVYRRLEKVTGKQKLAAFTAALDRLERDWGSWRVPWGEVNRFQRISPAINQPFSDAAPSTSVPFGSGRWGSLASFGAAPKSGTKRWYGTSGNSFVAVVEFGSKVRALAVTAGGASGNPASPHFNDQVARYAAGALREVYFHPEQLKGNVRHRYRPGTR